MAEHYCDFAQPSVAAAATIPQELTVITKDPLPSQDAATVEAMRTSAAGREGETLAPRPALYSMQASRRYALRARRSLSRGCGRWVDGLRELGAGLAAAGLRVSHHRVQLKYLVCGSHVVVEGTTEGNDGEGRSWKGGETPGVRFCNVFDFNDEGLIQQMYIYLDPDFAGADRDRFYWKRAAARW